MIKLIFTFFFVANHILAQKSSVSLLASFSTDSYHIEASGYVKLAKTYHFGLTYSNGFYGKTTSEEADLPYGDKYLPYLFREKQEYFDSYISLNYGQGVGIKFENNWGLSKELTLYLGTTFKIHFIKDFYSIKLKKYNGDELYYRNLNFLIRHKSISGGLNMGGRYKISKKFHLEGKLNFPFYYPIYSKYYNVLGSIYRTVGLEPNLSIGINYIIKKR